MQPGDDVLETSANSCMEMYSEEKFRDLLEKSYKVMVYKY